MIERVPRRFGRAAGLCATVAVLVSASAAFAGQSVLFSGSVYADYWGIPDKAVATRSPSGLVPEAAVKLSIDLNDTFSFSAKACASCHGVEPDHLMLEYMPSVHFNVQVGRLSIPFGEYSSRIDPAAHKTVSAPLIYDMGRMAYGERSAMNLGVVPLPYVDSGAMVYGQWYPVPMLVAWYAVYVTAGMRGGNDLDWTAMRSAPYRDNNGVPAVGGRVALNLITEPGRLLRDLGAGGSFTAGRYDPAGALDYQAWALNASTRLSIFTLRGEYAYRRTELVRGQAYAFELADDWFRKDGWYAELEHPLTSWASAVYRVDQLRRTGVPLPGSTLSARSSISRATAGIHVTPLDSLFAKVSYEYWSARDFDDFHSIHMGLGGAF